MVRELHRYPVKSMAGEQLEASAVGWHGLEDDRRYAFVRGDDDSGFPWLTIRQVPALTTYRPAAKDPLTVTTPAGARLDVRAPELAAELAAAYGGPVHLLRSDRGLFDAVTVSLLSLESVAALAGMVGDPLTAARFRPNVVVEAGDAFAEEGWVGATVAFGRGDDAARVRLDRRDKRCAVINFDPATAARDPRVLRAVAQRRDVQFGVYGSVERPGAIRVGDPVLVARA